MNQKQTVLLRKFEMLAYGVTGAVVTYVEVKAIYPTIASGTIEEMSFIGEVTDHLFVYGYRALIIHIIFLLFGFIFIYLSIKAGSFLLRR